RLCGLVHLGDGSLRRQSADAMAYARARAAGPMKRADASLESSGMPTRGALPIRGLVKIFEPGGVNIMAVDHCSMQITPGEFCMIVGPSGCGKTTLLNAIAGFHSITSGEIFLDDKLLCGPDKPIAAQGAYRIVVFQNGALFPWKTLAENVAYGPMVQGVLSKRHALAKAHEMLAEAGLGEFGGKYPGEVSSGMAPPAAREARDDINTPVLWCV